MASYSWNSNTYNGGNSYSSAALFALNQTIYDFAGWQRSSGADARSQFVPGTPKGAKVFVRANQYDPTRAHVVVFNWDLLDTVEADLSTVLPVGASFEIRNVQDYFGAPVLSGTYSGGLVVIPMEHLTVSAPVGWAAPAPTGPEFAAFIVLRK